MDESVGQWMNECVVYEVFSDWDPDEKEDRTDLYLSSNINEVFESLEMY